MADEEEGTVSSPAASPESHVPDHTVIWTNGRCILVPVTCDIATEYPEATRLPKEWEDEEEKKKEEKEEKKEEEKNFLHTDGRTGQSKVVQDVLADLKNL